MVKTPSNQMFATHVLLEWCLWFTVLLVRLKLKDILES